MNVPELRAAIARTGKKLSEIATELGISRTAFYKKIKGVTDFTQSEIAGLAKCLALSPEQILFIFFDSKVS